MSSEFRDNLALIGMPAVGKSTVGVLVAKRLSMRFIDTDLIIQAERGVSLQQLIATEGRATFRRIEEQVVLTLRPQTSVISTGGSVVYSDTALRHLREIAWVVYLCADLATIAGRIPDPDARGLIRRPGQTLTALYAERCPLYEAAADAVVNVTGLDAEAAAGAVAGASPLGRSIRS